MVTLSCLDDAPTAPPTDRVQLGISARILGQQAEGLVDLRVFYLRTTGDPVTVLEREIPIESGTQQISVVADVASCLADPLRVGGPQSTGCPLNVTFRLLDFSGNLYDSTTVGPVDAMPGETSEVPTVTLAAMSVELVPQATSVVGTDSLAPDGRGVKRCSFRWNAVVTGGSSGTWTEIHSTFTTSTGVYSYADSLERGTFTSGEHLFAWRYWFTWGTPNAPVYLPFTVSVWLSYVDNLNGATRATEPITLSCL